MRTNKVGHYPTTHLDQRQTEKSAVIVSSYDSLSSRLESQGVNLEIYGHDENNNNNVWLIWK